MVRHNLRKRKLGARRRSAKLWNGFQKWEKIRRNRTFFHLAPVNIDSDDCGSAQTKTVKIPRKTTKSKKY